jgi:glutathione S-transferase
MLPDRSRLLAVIGVATPPLEHAVVRAMFPLLTRLMRMAMRIDEPGAVRSRDRARRVFDEVGQRLSDGRRYLLGDTFGAADIAFASLASPLIAPPEHPFRRLTLESAPPSYAAEVRAFRETPAGAFALRVYREQRKSAAN